MGSWGAQRTLRGPDGSWMVLRCPRSNDWVFRGPEAVLRWFWGVLIFLGGQRSLEESCWIGGVLRVHEKPYGFEGWRYFLKGPSWPHRPFRTSRNPFDTSGPLGLLMTPYEPFNPSVTLRTHQSHRTPLHPSRPPQEHVWTSEYPLSTLGTLQNPSRPIRTPQGPLSSSGSHITILSTS